MARKRKTRQKREESAKRQFTKVQPRPRMEIETLSTSFPSVGMVPSASELISTRPAGKPGPGSLSNQAESPRHYSKLGGIKRQYSPRILKPLQFEKKSNDGSYVQNNVYFN